MQPIDRGFITVAEAIELIEKHTKDNPTVDLSFLVVNNGYIEKGNNFTIKLVDKAGNRVVEKGTVFARVVNDREKYTLRDVIKEAYKKNYNLDLNLDERPTKEITTIVDPKTNSKGVPLLDDSKDTMYFPTRDTRI